MDFAVLAGESRGHARQGEGFFQIDGTGPETENGAWFDREPGITRQQVLQKTRRHAQDRG